MQMFFCVVCIAIAGACLAQPVIVENENVRFRTLPNGHFQLTVCNWITCDLENDPLEALWSDAPFTIFRYTGHAIVPTDVSADAQYYEIVDFGEVFNRYIDNMPFHGGEVGPDAFYLGIWTPFSIHGQTFGWVKLAPVDGALTMVENVMAYRSLGIIVGKTSVVPEPTSVFMLTMGLAMFIGQYRRTRASLRDLTLHGDVPLRQELCVGKRVCG